MKHKYTPKLTIAADGTPGVSWRHFSENHTAHQERALSAWLDEFENRLFALRGPGVGDAPEPRIVITKSKQLLTDPDYHEETHIAHRNSSGLDTERPGVESSDC
jgi:hypothetical protein